MQEQRTGKIPWLSIIVPIYNAERYLEKCINSILSQTFSDFELLLVDDGSTDNSSKICRSYAARDSRVRYLPKQNGGPLCARVHGALRAQGVYLLFCDADDYYAGKESFSVLYEITRKKSCDLVQFGYYKKYNHLRLRENTVERTVEVDSVAFQNQDYPKLLCSFWEASRLTVSVVNKMYHRRLLAALPREESLEKLFMGEDLILNLHLLERCESALYLPDTLYVYRTGVGGSSNWSWNMMRDLDYIKMYQLHFLARWSGEQKEILRKILFSEIAGWFFLHIQDGIQKIPREELRECIEQTLALPRFVLAREYYQEQLDEHWQAAELLRAGEPERYLCEAETAIKTISRSEKLKVAVRRMLKRI